MHKKADFLPTASSPLALVSRALVVERLDLVEGAGKGIDDAVYIRIAGALVRQPRTSRRARGSMRQGKGNSLMTP